MSHKEIRVTKKSRNVKIKKKRKERKWLVRTTSSEDISMGKWGYEWKGKRLRGQLVLFYISR